MNVHVNGDPAVHNISCKQNHVLNPIKVELDKYMFNMMAF